MKYLLPLMAVCLLLAALSQWHTSQYTIPGTPYKHFTDWAYLLIIVILAIFAGTRVRYNDTLNYMRAFEKAQPLSVFLSDPRNFNLFRNPLFELYRSFLKTYTDNARWLILTSSVFTQVCFIRFIKRYSEDFTLSIFLYFTLGTFAFSLAAIKQVLAMAIITLAFPYLERHKWVRYYLMVLIAMMFHTYAIVYVMLPLFRRRPWKMFTFFFMAVMMLILFNFEEALTAFMNQANDLGKTLSDEEVFGEATINIFRLAVYAIPPLISLLLSRWALAGNTEMDNILIHMSIISFAFMSLGTQAGANMFGRMANFFEIGTLCCLPKMLRKSFEKQSFYMISCVAAICFLGFFYYANVVKLDFSIWYRRESLLSLLFGR